MNFEEFKEQFIDDIKKQLDENGIVANVAANVCDYTPVNLGVLIKNGILSGIESIHRKTINRTSVLYQ